MEPIEPATVVDLESQKASDKKATFSVKGMTCASCVASIEKYVLDQPGVKKVTHAPVFIIYIVFEAKFIISLSSTF